MDVSAPDADIVRTPDVESEAGESEPWVIAVLPDTQYSYYSSPSFFTAETQWIADNYQRENIAFVLHEGDIVDTPSDNGQWLAARGAMGLWAGQV